MRIIWRVVGRKVLAVGAEIGADGANDIYEAGDKAINGKEPEPTEPLKSESVEHQKGMKSALEGLKEIAAQRASHKSPA